MPDESPAASPAPGTPPPRTTGGNWRWEPPTADELQALMPGYTIEKLLGRGGMGAVYRGIQTNLDRPVAIKILPPGVEKEDPSFAERFKSEARLMAKLNHPAVVSVYDFGTTSAGQLYFAMEYVDGSDVAQMISAQGKLPPEHALAITAHVCDALSAAHELGIVHRDIKPANVLLNMKGQVKVADFGLAKVEEPGQHGLTKTGYAMGTPDFVAPEALTLGAAIDGRADIYAVGVMLYQMLTGNIPRGAFKPASVLVPGLDPRYDPIIQKAMQHDREERHQSAMELRRALDVILTVPLVRHNAPESAAIPVSQLAPAPGQRSAAQKPMAKGPPPRERGTPLPQSPVQSGEGAPRSQPKSKAPLYLSLGAAAAIGIAAFVMLKPASKRESKASDVAVSLLNTDGGRHPEYFPLPIPKRPAEAGRVVVWRLDGKPLDPSDPEVKMPDGLDDVVMLAAGQGGSNPPTPQHLLALHQNGTVSAWGGNDRGEATPPPNLTNVISVAATDFMSIALDASGHVLPWGESAKVNGLPHITEKVVAVSGSKNLGAMLLSSGKLVAFGDAGAVKLVADSSAPLSGRVISMTSSGDFMAALRDDGALFALGYALGMVNGREGRHPITETRLAVPGFPETNRFPLASGNSSQLWVNNPTTDVWVSGFEKTPSRIRPELPGDVKNSSKFLLMKTLDFAGLERVDQSEFAAALKFGSSWRFDRASGASNLPFCEKQAEGCLQLVLTKTHAFGIKPLSVIAAQQVAAAPVPVRLAAPASSSSSQFPPGKWVKVFTKLEDLPENLRKPDSGVSFIKDGSLRLASTKLSLPGSLTTNYAVRAHFTYLSTGARSTLAVRRAEGLKTNYYEARAINNALVCQTREDRDVQSIAEKAIDGSLKVREGQDYTLEFAAIGSRLIARYGDQVVLTCSNERFPRGGALIYGGEPIRDIEVINLDGLSEAEALKILGINEKGNDLRNPTAIASASPNPAPSSATPPVAQSGTQFPPGQWVKVFTKAEDLPSHLLKPESGVQLVNGILEVSKPGTYLGLTPPTGTLKNCGVRAVISQKNFIIRLRDAGTMNFYGFWGDSIRSHRRTQISAPENMQKLAVFTAPEAPSEKRWEFFAVGKRLVTRCEDKILSSTVDDHIENGKMVFANIGGIIRDIEVINLDGLSEAEALKMVGVDENGNDTRAATIAQEKKAMEQAKVVDAMASIPELKALHDQFVKLTAERVTAPFTADVAKLNAGYVGGIDRKIAEEKAAGQLDGVIALEAEKKLLADQYPIPAEDAEGTLANLKALRTIYRAAYAKIDAARAASLKLLTDPLTLRLRQLEAGLTKKDRIPDAKTVREYREKLTEENTSVPAGTGQTASNPTSGTAATKMNAANKNAGGAPSATRLPKIPKPKDAFTEREAAEWALSFAGKGDVGVTVQVPGKSEERIQSLALLPKDNFVVLKLTVQPTQEIDQNLITDQVALRLMGLEQLKVIHLNNPKLPSHSLRALVQNPILEELSFPAGNFEATDLGALENASIKLLILTGLRVDNAGALRVLSTLKNLRELNLGSLTTAMVDAMPVLSKLEVLRTAANAAVKDELLPLLPVKFPALQGLHMFGVKNLQGQTLVSLNELKDLQALLLVDTQVDDTKLAAIAGMKRLWQLTLGQSRITDACISTLRTFKNLEKLSIFQTQITDAGLLELAELRSLKTLEVRHISSPPIGPPATGFTEAGVTAFQKKRPDVKVTR